MHKYASSSAESRELVSELEFVWDQVKSNVPSSSSSSPLRTMGMPLDMSRHGEPPKDPTLDSAAAMDKRLSGEPMRIMSPISQSQEEELEAQEDEGEEFVDAPDSQVEEPPTRNIDAEISSPSGHDREVSPDERPKTRRKSSSGSGPKDERWRKRVESALVKMTAEVAALREQLETRRLFSHTFRFRILRFFTQTVFGILKHAAIDVFLLCIVLLWLRRKKDRRLEGAVRVLLGDAVAQVQKVGEKQLGKIQLPIIGGNKRPN